MMSTTAIFGVLDLDELSFTFCGAGHLPLVVISARDGTARLEQGVGPLLGIGLAVPEAIRLDLEPGDRIGMVTDGLIERRDESIDVGLGRLQSAAAEGRHRTIDQLVDHLLLTVGPGAVPDDDIAIIAFELSTSALPKELD